MEDRLKIRTHFAALRRDITETMPHLNKELTSRISAFENITAPEKGIYSHEERYWVAKTAVVVEFLKDSVLDKKEVGKGYLVSCGYDETEIAKVDWFINQKLERRVLRPQNK